MYRFLFVFFFATVLSACTGTIPGSTYPTSGMVYESRQSVRTDVEVISSGLMACPSFYEGMSPKEVRLIHECHRNYLRWYKTGQAQQRENERQELARRRQTDREIDNVVKRTRSGVDIFGRAVAIIDRHRNRR